LSRSRYFQTDGQVDITALIRGLSIKTGSGLIGRAFQGYAAVRKISTLDHIVLTGYAKNLPPEPRARLVPEERLEVLVSQADEPAVEALLQEEPSGLAASRKRYLMSRAISRDRTLTYAMRELYEGQCQICRWSPRSIYEQDVCETHHVQWLSRGGRDAESNLVVICPNHHRAIHRCDAQFDWEQYSFVFSPKHMEPLAVRKHLLEP
jgi:hypothetical protein